MNNKHALFLAELQKDMAEFVKADIGKAARADLKALEKAAGGKQKLDKADEILAGAREEAKQIVANAKAEAEGVLSDADRKIALITAEQNNAQAEIRKNKADIAEVWREIELERADFFEKGKELADRKTAVAAREADVAKKENGLAKWEQQLDERQRILDAKDKYYREAPH